MAVDPFSDAFRILGPQGTVDEEAEARLGLANDQIVDLYRLMLLARRVDAEATALQRQGELAVWAPLVGQEAAQVGSACALGPDDFAFPSYRELAVALVRGVDLVDYLHFYRGTWHGGTYDPAKHRFGMVCVPVASQIPHAVGYALGIKLDGGQGASVAYFGDGATSQGDFHEGCNFAAVFGAPVVFFCQNNQWAISVPLARQTAAPIWRKAQAYGFPGLRVDGNDVLAVNLVMREALERARAGTPTLIEAVTYRIGPHSTADDASRYRPQSEVESWQAFDPIERLRLFLRGRGLLDEDREAGFKKEGDDLAAYVRSGIAGSPPPPVEDLFRWVFEEKSPHLLRQEKDLLEEASSLMEGTPGDDD